LEDEAALKLEYEAGYAAVMAQQGVSSSDEEYDEEAIARDEAEAAYAYSVLNILSSCEFIRTRIP
jgi:hypothetical protein